MSPSESAVFEAAVHTVLAHEGGYTNNPRDPGGETNMGISRRQYPNEEIKNLTVDRAKAIYMTDYWLRYRINQLPGVAIPVKVMDTAVVCGPTVAVKILQSSLSALGARCDVDGVIGPGTAGACRSVNQDALLGMYREFLLSHFEAIVAAHPEESVFMAGWKRRALA